MKVRVDWDEDSGPYGVRKFCDGTTLLYEYVGYRRGGVAAVPSSPECAR